VALGTDNGKALVDYLRGYLKKTDFLLNTEAVVTKKNGNNFRLVCRCNKKQINYMLKLFWPLRTSGAYWFRDIANELNINNNFGPIDVEFA